MSTVTTDGSLNANIGGSIKSEVVELLFKIHFSHSGIGKFYAQIKLVLRDEKVEEVNFYSFVVVVFFCFLGQCGDGGGPGCSLEAPHLYCCFVDFQKAFYSVWYNGLLYKLFDNKIGGKFYNFIADMYSRSKCVIKIGNNRTDYFNYNKGERQRCILFPLLFSLYLDYI